MVPSDLLLVCHHVGRDVLFQLMFLGLQDINQTGVVKAVPRSGTRSVERCLDRALIERVEGDLRRAHLFGPLLLGKLGCFLGFLLLLGPQLRLPLVHLSESRAASSHLCPTLEPQSAPSEVNLPAFPR